MKTIFFTLLINVLYVSISFSETVYSGTCTSTFCEGKINMLYVHKNSKIYIYQDVANHDSLACNLDQGTIALKKSNPMQKEIYSLLLAAQLSGKEVRIRVDNQTPQIGCEVVYVQLRTP